MPELEINYLLFTVLLFTKNMVRLLFNKFVSEGLFSSFFLRGGVLICPPFLCLCYVAYLGFSISV